jgi:hypothetical protein
MAAKPLCAASIDDAVVLEINLCRYAANNECRCFAGIRETAKHRATFRGKQTKAGRPQIIFGAFLAVFAM